MNQQDKSQTGKGLTRRTILKSSVAAGGIAASGILGSPVQASAARKAGLYDVVVLGGGFAGVTAARDLGKKGYSVLLLEARNRLGGRTFSARMGKHHVELGGFWVHWTQPFVWSEVQRYGLEVEQTPGSNPNRMFVSVQGKSREIPANMLEFGGNDAFEKLFASSKQMFERPYDQSYAWDEIVKADTLSVTQAMAEYDLDPEERQSIDSVVAVMAHAMPDKAAFVEMARWFAAAGWHYDTLTDATARYALKEGTISLINAMLDDGNTQVKLSSPVSSVTQSDDKVVVKTEHGERYTTAAVVNTLPMNVVRNVKFEPALSSIKMQGSQEKHAGSGVKVYMEIDGSWGPIAGLAASSDPLNYIMTYKELESTTLLLGFGARATELDPNDTAEVQKALSRILPKVNVINSLGYDWTLDSFSQGTWCTYRPGQLTRFGSEMTRHEGRVFMASGDHGEGWRGFIDGAIARGIQVAEDVESVLGTRNRS